NGPSLNKTPLDDIDTIAIGMNKINLLYEKTSWRPQMIVCTNGLVIKQNKDFFNTTSTPLFFPVKACYLGIKNRENVFFLNLVDEPVLNENIRKKISSGCTVTYLAFQIAAYLKATEVNVVGVDHSFVYQGKDQEIKKMEGDDVNHFSKDYFKGQYWGNPNLDGSEVLYSISKDYFESKGVPILDYTVNGKLQIFQKGDIQDLIEKYPKKVRA
ncbi:MAG: hypothetical protein AAFO99_08355, partial [Bacteroidota bacterium]